MSADVYAHPMHVGRGGWSWYTGSAAWMYRTAVEGLLGLYREGATFRIDPCIPAMWPGYTLEWRVNATVYRIAVTNPTNRGRGVHAATLDEAPVDPSAIPLLDDGQVHVVSVVLGPPPAPERDGERRRRRTPGMVPGPP